MLQQDSDEVNKPLKLEISTSQSDEKAWIEINDNGPGIPDEMIGNVFEPLYSTKTYGVGLGLPIVRQILEQHSGEILISSQPGTGTKVKLWFPLVK